MRRRGYRPRTRPPGKAPLANWLLHTTWPRYGLAAAPLRSGEMQADARRRLVGTADSVQPGQVMRQVLDVGIAQRLGDTGHVAGVVGAMSGLEVLQLLDDVVVLLAGNARDCVLSHEAAQVA